MSWPLGRDPVETSERQGRIVFGVAAVSIGVFLIALTIVSVRRLGRAIERQRTDRQM